MQLIDGYCVRDVGEAPFRTSPIMSKLGSVSLGVAPTSLADLLPPVRENGGVASGESIGTRRTDERDREKVRRLAHHGVSVELIARAISRTRYFVESTLDRAPAGRADVPYRYREIRATADVAGRYRTGEAAEDIAHDIGVSVTTVFEWLRADGVELRGKAGSHALSYADVLTREFLVASYVNERRTTSEIAQQVGCSESTVRNWLRRHDIAARPISERRRAYVIDSHLLDDVAEGRKGVENAAVAAGCSRSELLRELRRSGRNLPRDRRTPLTAVLLRDMYVKAEMSCPEIASATGWAAGTVRSRLKEYGIPRKVGRRPGRT